MRLFERDIERKRSYIKGIQINLSTFLILMYFAKQFHYGVHRKQKTS